MTITFIYEDWWWAGLTALIVSQVGVYLYYRLRYGAR